MRSPQTPVEEQVEAAFDFRGDVTVRLRGGEELQGFLFNRDFAPHGSLASAPFVELYLSGGDKRTVLIDAIEGIELSGKDHAATDPA